MSVLSPSTGSWLRPQALSLRKRRNRLIVVSNRLPVVFRTDDDGRLRREPGSGGLVTALAPVLRDRGGIWIGWPGTTAGREEIDRAVADASEQLGYAFNPVILSAAEIQGFYHGFANEILWPLFHDLETLCNYEPRYWQAYREVNRRFAEVICETAQAGDFIWIHDYHLMGVAAELRRPGVKSKIGFFLHVPFPPLDTFLKLPWRMSLLQGLLECDLIGLQTLQDQRNLVQCLQFLRKEIQVQGKGQVVTTTTRDREVKIGHFPISGHYSDLLDGSYDCVDRIVLNDYFRLAYSAGGFRRWWRRLHGGSNGGALQPPGAWLRKSAYPAALEPVGPRRSRWQRT